MQAHVVLLILAGLCVAWAVVSAVFITAALDRRGIRTSFVLMRFRFLGHLSQYREITRRETGRTGFWFYSYVISINAMWILGLAAAAVIAWK